MSHAVDDETTTQDPAEAPRRARRRRIPLVTGAVVVVVALAVAVVVVVRTGGGHAAEAAPATVPVAITVSHVPAHTELGVILTLGTGEGAEWSEAAQGAVVAQHRLALGGTDVTLVTENDEGTTAGAQKAVEALAARGVAGIVVASSGEHVDGAVAAAAKAGIPVVLPYAESGGDDSWSLEPSSAEVGAGLRKALGTARRPLLVDLGGAAPAGTSFVRVIGDDGSVDDAALAAEVARSTGASGTADAVLVSGPAPRQASFLAALQSSDVTVPVVLTPDATSPAFGTALLAAGGSTSGTFTTAGVAADDSVALQSDAAGRAMSAFLAGVRVTAGSSTVKNLTGDQEFSAVAADADSRSHDAVVALVQAVSTARSDTPSSVATALGALRAGVDDGIAGPALDFGRGQAGPGSTTVLYASGQPLGLRGSSAADDQRLIWFAEGTSTTR